MLLKVKWKSAVKSLQRMKARRWNVVMLSTLISMFPHSSSWGPRRSSAKTCNPSVSQTEATTLYPNHVRSLAGAEVTNTQRHRLPSSWKPMWHSLRKRGATRNTCTVLREGTGPDRYERVYNTHYFHRWLLLTVCVCRETRAAPWSVRMERLLGWCPQEAFCLQMAQLYTLTLKYLTIKNGSNWSIKKLHSSNSAKFELIYSDTRLWGIYLIIGLKHKKITVLFAFLCCYILCL